MTVHSDRGGQYASAAYQAWLNTQGWVGSLGRQDNGWDTPLGMPLNAAFGLARIEIGALSLR